MVEGNKGAELAAVAAFVGQHPEREVLVPASRVREKLTGKIEGLTFAEAIRELGLDLAPEVWTIPGIRDWPAAVNQHLRDRLDDRLPG